MEDNTRFTLLHLNHEYSLKIPLESGPGTSPLGASKAHYPNRGEWAHALMKHSEAAAAARAKARERRQAAVVSPEAAHRAKLAEIAPPKEVLASMPSRNGSNRKTLVDYIVQDDDTIAGVAMAHGVSPTWLKRKNGGSGMLFEVGDVIQVPQLESTEKEGGDSTDIKEAGATSSDLDELIRECFMRYDFDSSNTVDSREELKQLVTNLVFRMEGLTSTAPNIDSACSALDPAEEPLTLPMFTKWFKSEYNLK